MKSVSYTPGYMYLIAIILALPTTWLVVGRSGEEVPGMIAMVDLISDALPFGRLWYGEPNAVSNAIGYAKFYSRSHDVVVRVYDEAGNVIETQEHAGDSKEP
jgi:hypothetical protein